MIPKDGTQLEVEACGLHIKVTEITDRRVEWTLVSKIAPVDEDEDEEKDDD